jgi:hypothetical protein
LQKLAVNGLHGPLCACDSKKEIAQMHRNVVISPAAHGRSRVLLALLALAGATGCWGSAFTSQIQEQIIWGPPVDGDSTLYNSGQLPQVSLANGLVSPPGTGVVSTGSIGAGQLHGLASTTNSFTQATFSGLWMDTVLVGGLPTGTSVTLLITDSLDSGLTVAPGATAQILSSVLFPDMTSDNLSLSNTSSNVQNGQQTASGEVTIPSGSSLEFDENLYLMVINNATAGATVADASDTNTVSIAILTPGATVTSASGVSYAASATPEPSTAVAMLAGLAVCFLARKQRRSRAMIR